MRIEIKNLKLMPSLSEETNAYTATIWIDGKAAISAKNGGYGGPDEFHPLEGGWKVIEAVEAYLAEHEPPSGPFDADPAKRQPYDTGSACDLESFIAREVERRDGEKQFARVLNRVSVLSDGKILSYQAKFKPTAENLAKIAPKLKAGEELINGGSDDLIRRAKLAFGLRDEDHEAAVFERLASGALTAADCRWLIAKEKRGEKVEHNLAASLEEIAEAQEKAYADYRAERDAERERQMAERKPVAA